ncbi:MAG TPA: transglutaminase-like domain-containing protein [Stellaceae bacterium]|jgi:regulator of sirC expression with transglutaminase-like and TPR domain|nr:transglutaminase-like domain-containing protein [Stellaceae bacterium]
MSEPPERPEAQRREAPHLEAERPDTESCARFLRELGASEGRVLPIAEAALALASFERQRVDFARYREHLRLIARDVGRHPAAAGDLAGRARALNEIILLKYGYCGDELTYDDVQNANLMRVIDRRKGLPVVLGILFIDVARAQGWQAAGLAFPGHFLIRLAERAERLILDPFHGGQVCGAAELRELLKAVVGEDRELAPQYYAPVSDRDVLLRLQNNLKSRLIQEQRHERAVKIVETMLMLAPDLDELWREAGLLHRQLGNLRAAAAAFEQYVVRARDGAARHQAAAILQQLRGQLN